MTAEPENYHKKLQKLEILVDGLIEERKSLRNDLRKLEDKLRNETSSSDSLLQDDFIKTLEDLRSKLGKSEATNQKLQREKNQVKDRLEQIRERLDLIESRLLEQRQAGVK